MINIIRGYFIKRKRDKRIKYPKKFIKTVDDKGIKDKYTFDKCVDIQTDIKKRTMKYFTIYECYDLWRIAKSSDYDIIKEFIR